MADNYVYIVNKAEREIGNTYDEMNRQLTCGNHEQLRYCLEWKAVSRDCEWWNDGTVFCRLRTPGCENRFHLTGSYHSAYGNFDDENATN